MITIKFYKEKKKDKYKALVVHTKYYTIEIPHYVYCGNQKDYYYNILEKIYNDDPFKEITEYDFIYIDHCLNEIEKWLATINEKVKEDEKKIQEALDNLEFYQLYKSQKVIEKLEDKGE